MKGIAIRYPMPDSACRDAGSVSIPSLGLYSFCIVDTRKQDVLRRTSENADRWISQTGRNNKGQRELR